MSFSDKLLDPFQLFGRCKLGVVIFFPDDLAKPPFRCPAILLTDGEKDFRFI